MTSYLLSLLLLGTAAFSLAATLHPWFQNWAGNRTKSGNLLAVALGDGRRMFANHFFVKADAYFHSGCYPTIFDNREAYQTPHIGEDSGALEGRNKGDEHEFLGPPRDWIDAFSRQFFPSTHTHLGEGAPGELEGGSEREMLPWLRLSAEMDPQRVETYVVASYWLRRIKNAGAAEQFLRDGLQANPGDPQIQFELGAVLYENAGDVARARNLWELALANWRQKEARKSEPNIFLQAQILNGLAKLEYAQGDFAKSAHWYRQLLLISPYKDSIRKWIEECEAKAASRPVVKPGPGP